MLLIRLVRKNDLVGHSSWVFRVFFVIFVLIERRTSLRLNHKNLLRLGVKQVRKKKGNGLKRFLSRSRRRFFKKWQDTEFND